jgi:hypothetical protein
MKRERGRVLFPDLCIRTYRSSTASLIISSQRSCFPLCAAISYLFEFLNDMYGDKGVSISWMNFARYSAGSGRRVISNGLIFATQNYVGRHVRRNQVEMLPGQ